MNQVIQDYRVSAQFIGEQEGKLWYSINGGYLIIIPLEHIMYQDIEELAAMCQFIMALGETEVAFPIKNKNDEWITQGDQEHSFVAFFVKAERSGGNSGKTLGHFHKGTQSFSLKRYEAQPYFHWAKFWMTRTDQVKQCYLDTLRKEYHTEFEKLFLSVYPYFLGRAENAIQYITDYTMDYTISQAPTICHHRLDSRLEKLTYSPEWVVDHPARDVAEWMRSQIDEDHPEFEAMTAFINDYNEVLPLQLSDYGLIYGRLLFPASFFDLMDQVIIRNETDNSSLVDHLRTIIKRVKQEEEVLSLFSHEFMTQLPKIQWLS